MAHSDFKISENFMSFISVTESNLVSKDIVFLIFLVGPNLADSLYFFYQKFNDIFLLWKVEIFLYILIDIH